MLIRHDMKKSISKKLYNILFEDRVMGVTKVDILWSLLIIINQIRNRYFLRIVCGAGFLNSIITVILEYII